MLKSTALHRSCSTNVLLACAGDIHEIAQTMHYSFANSALCLQPLVYLDEQLQWLFAQEIYTRLPKTCVRFEESFLFLWLLKA